MTNYTLAAHHGFPGHKGYHHKNMSASYEYNRGSHKASLSYNTRTDNSGVHPTLNTAFPSRTVYRSKGESRRHKRRRQAEQNRTLKGLLDTITPQKFESVCLNTITTLSDLQGMYWLPAMYSMAGSGVQYNHVQSIGNAITPLAAGTTALGWPGQFSSEKKVKFMSCRMVMEICNLQTLNAVYCTIYEYYFTRDVVNGTFASLFTTQSNFPTTTAIPISVTAGIANINVAVTPFDLDEVISKIHITKKTELYLAPNSSQEFEMYDLKPKTFDYSWFQSKTNPIARAGWTKGVIVAIAGPANATTPATPLAAGVSFLQTFRYSVKPIPDSLLMGTSTLQSI